MSLTKPKVNLLVPAAGLGSRFRSKGFAIPKPMIEYRSKSLLDHSVESVRTNFEVQQMVVVLNRQHIESDNIDAFVARRYPDATQFIVDGLTRGAAETAYLGLASIRNKSLPLIINDCDHRFGKVSNLDTYDSEDWDARINYFASTDPRFCFVEVKGNQVSRIVEKQVISSSAVAGCYVFRDVATYITGYAKVRNRNLQNGEEFVSLVIQEIISENGRVFADEIFEHQDLGVPEALVAEDE